ncbi:stage II sporulation protein P [Halanaerobaculum tunisiense]
MGKKLISLLLVLIIISYLFWGVEEVRLSSSKLINQLARLVELDMAQAKFLLQEGLPIIRASNQLEANNSPTILDSFCQITTGLPLSFFKTKVALEKPVASVVSRLQSKLQLEKKEVEEKLEAEGRHTNEKQRKVKLDFWQTEPQTDAPTKQDKKEDVFQEDNEYNQERFIPNKGSLVGIYHTHTSENYNNRGHNAHASAGQQGGVVEAGKALANRLETKYDISVAHSTRVNDRTYARSYINSLNTARQMIKDNPDLEMIFDIHRDAVADATDGFFTTEINGQQVAKIMIVVTNNNYSLPHPDWRQNLKFAKRLGEKMEKMYPGLLREVELVSNRRYNQHIHPHALLLEMGGASNTIAEVRRSANLFADVLARLVQEGG